MMHTKAINCFWRVPKLGFHSENTSRNSGCEQLPIFPYFRYNYNNIFIDIQPVICYYNRACFERSIHAGMAELADAPDLGSGPRGYRFKSCYPHFKGFLQIVEILFLYFDINFDINES